MEKLTLLLTPEQADAHCRTLIAQTRQAGQALAALISLQTFIDACADAGQQAGALRAVKLVFEQHIALARDRVMAENLAALADALERLDLCGIRQVHAALSRNGFHQTALAAFQRLSDATLSATAAWVAGWHRDAQARAKAASPYPDALDLSGAGISATDFAAMAELHAYLDCRRT